MLRVALRRAPGPQGGVNLGPSSLVRRLSQSGPVPASALGEGLPPPLKGNAALEEIRRRSRGPLSKKLVVVDGASAGLPARLARRPCHVDPSQ